MTSHADLRILLLEDDPDHAQLLSHCLRQAFEARIIHHSAALPALAELEKSDFDLLLLDYYLPDLDGLEVLRRCRITHPDLPVLMITGQGDERIAVEAMKAGAFDYLVKGRDYLAILPLAVRRTLEKAALQRRLGETESRYQRLVQNALVGIFQATPAGRLLMVNDAFVRILGYDQPGELLQANLPHDLFLNPADFATLCGRLAGQDEIRDEMHTYRRKDGTPIVLRESMRAVRGAAGELLHFEGIVQDITRQQRAEAEIRRLANFPKLSPHLILELNEWGGVQYFNPATAAFLQQQNKTAEEIYTILPDDLAAICRELLAPVPSRRIIQREVSVAGRIIQYALHSIPEERVVHVHGLDITEQRHLELQLQQARQMESIGRLAGGIAHDFNNLLMGIIGYASLMKDELPVDDRHYADVCEIETAAQRASEITRQLLLYSRRAVGQLIEVDVNELIESVLETVRRNLPAGVPVQTVFAAGLPKLRLDPMLFHQVMKSLLENAAEAMAYRGEITVRTYASDHQEPDVLTQLTARPGNFVVVAIRDTGTGIAPENLPLIFEPFFSTKAVGKGSGLGLPTAYGIVRSHGGVIHVESEPGRGTEFRIYFPAAEEGGH
ncbi:MAG: ATP-binding protein [candidate division KSB1 bacterium]|nr:ATP-binding protein [candidate division KSB1 bacterium]MDZ7285803.1 ATP-binding protein [candidate division KSB1 bacterium]MDZ7298835.1 ATP-binding protein [candidate division KSB1 bacterium]MDZ7308864.1 ATP-binding protein [candidate division KSB1 bacterium]MDZ7353124.1 ATP-binding protein [candidate division KSB1 bacterium]